MATIETAQDRVRAMCEKAMVSKGGTIRLDVKLVLAALGEKESARGTRDTTKVDAVLEGREE